jgi:exosortase D (VPLPA-CTERM-specific)
LTTKIPSLSRSSALFWLSCLGYGLLLWFVYQSSLTYLYGKWQTEDFSYCYVVPPMVIYLLWEKRTRLGQLPSRPSWWAAVLLVPGVLLYWVGELGGEFTLQFLSLWLVGVALCWLHLGWAKLRIIAFPLVFSLAAFVPPNALYLPLTFRLKLISSQIGVQMLHLYGLTAYREGNIIDLGFTQLEVVDACSGLRYVIPLFLMGILMVYFFRMAAWKRVLLVLSTIPVSIFTNSLRIASVGILYQYVGAAAAEGFLHDFSGWFIFMSGLVLLLLEVWILKKLFPEPARPPAPAVLPGAVPGPAAASVPLGAQGRRFVAAAFLLAATPLLAQSLDLRGSTPVLRPLADFPLQVGQWQGTPAVLAPEFLTVLKLSDYALVDYRDPGGRLINFYVAYNDSQRKGESTHSPATCLPGSGWEFRESGLARLAGVRGTAELKVSRAFMEKSGARQLTYYWFPQRGRVLNNLYQVKLYNFLDALFRQRTDGALVRLVTPVYHTESPEAAAERLQAFTRQIVPLLDGFLPK